MPTDKPSSYGYVRPAPPADWYATLCEPFRIGDAIIVFALTVGAVIEAILIGQALAAG